MTIVEAIESYLTLKRSLEAVFRSDASILRSLGRDGTKGGRAPLARRRRNPQFIPNRRIGIACCFAASGPTRSSVTFGRIDPARLLSPHASPVFPLHPMDCLTVD